MAVVLAVVLEYVLPGLAHTRGKPLAKGFTLSRIPGSG